MVESNSPVLTVIERVYLEFAQFVIGQLGEPYEGKIQFRFARPPKLISESDLSAPGTGRNAALAQEFLSALCDKVPLLHSDEQTVSFGSASLSEVYEQEVLAASVGSTETFMLAKAEAIRLLRNNLRASVISGPGAQYYLTTATPSMWWPSDSDVWTSKRIVIKAPPAPVRNSFFRSLGALLVSSADQLSADIEFNFEYCVINVARPWLKEAFLRDEPFYVKDRLRGAFSANDGRSLSFLPVALMVIKNLEITAPWNENELSSPDKGLVPFSVSSKVSRGALTEQRMQVVGWLLSDLPALPPLDAPGINSELPRLSAVGQPRSDLFWWAQKRIPRGNAQIWLVDQVDKNVLYGELDIRKPTVVFISAAWAGPSQLCDPLIEILAREMRDIVKFVELNADDASEDLKQLELTVVPTFLFATKDEWQPSLGGFVPNIVIDRVKELRDSLPSPYPVHLQAPLIAVPIVLPGNIQAVVSQGSHLVFFSRRGSELSDAMSSSVEAMSILCGVAFCVHEVALDDQSIYARSLGIAGLPFAIVRYANGKPIVTIPGDKATVDLVKEGGWLEFVRRLRDSQTERPDVTEKFSSLVETWIARAMASTPSQETLPVFAPYTWLLKSTTPATVGTAAGTNISFDQYGNVRWDFRMAFLPQIIVKVNGAGTWRYDTGNRLLIIRGTAAPEIPISLSQFVDNSRITINTGMAFRIMSISTHTITAIDNADNSDWILQRQ